MLSVVVVFINSRYFFYSFFILLVSHNVHTNRQTHRHFRVSNCKCNNILSDSIFNQTKYAAHIACVVRLGCFFSNKQTNNNNNRKENPGWSVELSGSNLIQFTQLTLTNSDDKNQTKKKKLHRQNQTT